MSCRLLVTLQRESLLARDVGERGEARVAISRTKVFETRHAAHTRHRVSPVTQSVVAATTGPGEGCTWRAGATPRHPRAAAATAWGWRSWCHPARQACPRGRPSPRVRSRPRA